VFWALSVNLLSVDVIVRLYTTLVCPIIEYNNVLWAPTYILDNQKLERIQRKATRIIKYFCMSSLTSIVFMDVQTYTFILFLQLQ